MKNIISTSINFKQLFFLSFFILLCFSYANAASAPEYIRTKNWKIATLNTTTIELTADIVFYNPNKVNAKLKDLNLDVFINDKFVGKVIQENMVKIPGKSSFDIPIRFKFDLIKSELGFSSILGLFTNNKFIVDIKGFLKANVFLLPFKIKLNERQEFTAKDFL